MAGASHIFRLIPRCYFNFLLSFRIGNPNLLCDGTARKGIDDPRGRCLGELGEALAILSINNSSV